MLEAHAAHDLSDAALGDSPLRIRGSRFVDGYGRVVIPRGLNVSGCSKLPLTPDGRSHLTEGFYDRHRTVSFVGRPFPLADAPVHFARLRSWGMTFIRLLVTWESLGYAGPNPATDLDGEYIAYLRSLIDMMPQFGLKCFVCAHQDVWSRYSGGSGAPAWTFEAAGLDVEAFTDTGAAYIHGQDEARRRARAPLPPGVKDKEPSGPFVWPSGYQKLAASTMATLFWAGEALAPKLRCRRSRPGSGGDGKEEEEEEVSIQSFLQDALIEAFGALADAVGPLEACIGFEAMNEPHRGLVNLHSVDSWNYDTDLHIGHYPSFPQALALGSGHAQQVPFYVKTWPYPTKVSHYSLLDPKGRSAWLAAADEGEQKADRPKGLGQCVWRAHGVWEWDEKTQKAVVLDKKYFEHDHRAGSGGRKDGKKLEWYRDCYAPFVRRFHERMGRYSSSSSSSASSTTTLTNMAFVAPIPNEFIPPWQPLKHETAARRQTYAVKTIIDTPRPHNMVYAPHFYDLNVLFNKAYGSVMSVDVQGLSRGVFPLKALHFLSAGLRRNYARQIRNIVRHGPLSLGANSAPTIIGEIGIPFDVNGKAAYKSGNFDVHRDLYNALIAAMEDCLVGFTLWNYNPGNTVEHGDGWNKEDFSMVTSDRAPDHTPDYRNARHEADPTYTGGRALDVVIRPYAAKIAGEPLRTSWDERTLRFELEWEEVRQSSSSALLSAGAGTSRKAARDQQKKPQGLLDALEDRAHQTEVFIPAYHYAGKKLAVSVSGDADWSYNAAQQTLYVRQAAAAAAGGAVAAKLAATRHRLVVEIRDVHAHLLDRVVQRRRLLPKSELGLWGLVLGVAPPEVEVWVENLLAGRDEAFLGVLVALLVLLLAVVMAQVM